ncbi:chondroitin sulfate proteoglycan 4 [Bufo gargarizans]|uniref:chondroitin sulfate proteoglycan 4 n=1 Tax=Bufo gargarizans TaxID=30331 RepID=UPI001CF102CB|nr:chondroitin sulfate proteoglycan 4 [Bufo gargarizans]
MMAGGHRLLLLLLLGGVLQDMGSEGQNTTEEPNLQRTTNISLHMTFVSAEDSGLLFLASGEAQYLLVELVNGTIRARMKKDKRESILSFPKWTDLKNSENHKIGLQVTESQMILTLDNLTHILDLSWPHQKLFTYHSIFLGGAGGNNTPDDFEPIPTFRGCIMEAKFDKMDLLSGSFPQVELHGQWEICHSDFQTSTTGSFGFIGSRSYIKFPNWNMKPFASIEITLETPRPGRAPLIYQPGLQKSYLYVEIAGGQIQGVFDSGVSAVKFQNPIYISDSQIHTIQISVDSSNIQLTVDKTSTQISLNSMQQKWDINGDLYLGGVDDITLAKMREGPLGNIFIDDMEYKSFSGCIMNLKINSKRMEIHDALTSRDIIDGCHEYDDYGEYDDFITTIIPTTAQTIFESLYDICKLKPNTAKPKLLLNPMPLAVARGQSAFLEWKNVQPAIDLDKVGLRQSQLVFSLVGNTQHGQLELGIPGGETRKKFTLLDISSHRVRYIHDGSESYNDQLNLEISLASGINVPECLRKPQQFNLTIFVSPYIATPLIQFPKGNTFWVLPYGQKVLTMDIIEITDLDTPCDLLTIYVIGDTKQGQFEIQGTPGEAVPEFSCKDFEAGQVIFVHKSGQGAHFTIQVSDGTSRSSPELINFLVLEPLINITQNALVVHQGMSALITPSNLPLVTNADKLGMEVTYQLLDYPRLGMVQTFVPGEGWKATDTFNQHDLERSGVRYQSAESELRGEELSEDMKVQLKLGTQVVTNNTFQVKVKRSTLQMMRMVSLKLGKKRDVNLTDKYLQVDTSMTGPELASFVYFIVQSPRKGNLLLDGRRIMEGSHFTQEDVNNGHVSYAATVRNTMEMEDQVQFQVLHNSRNSPIFTYKILIGVDPDAPQLTNQLLHVLEGETGSITQDHLFIKSSRSTSFIYEVIDGPQHGTLIRKGNTQSGHEEGVTEFTNDDILDGLLFYKHDGSETTEDDIPFVVFRQLEGSASETSGEGEDKEEEVVRDVFRVSIQPVNDNAPKQIVHKIFNVVRDGQKLLTTNDIAFLDTDSGTTDSQIVLVRYGVSFGRIVFVDDPSLVVMRFTQDDIRRHRILFIHSGPDQGSIQLQVSDGLHHLTTILEVHASEPFINISNITTLNVLLGGKGSLTTTNVNIETNLDLRADDEIKYYIKTKPRWGDILRGGKPTESFSQQDLADGLVVYRHSGEGSNRDHFRISVEANQVEAVGDIKVQVISDSPPVPLKVINNEKVYVFQGEAAEIKKEYLLVSAEGIFPDKIAYSLTGSPYFGHLVSVSGELSSDGSPSLDFVYTFTQEDVNKGRILYLHSSTDMLPDQMMLEVSAGGTTLEIVVPLEIISVYIPLEANELMVVEGGTTALSNNILQVPNDYYLGLNLDLIILEGPKNGRIINAEKNDLRDFSWNELEQGRVFYEHDGSETRNDSVTVMANASDVNHHSKAVTISVIIQAVNDEKPRVVTNNGMQILEGDTAVITTDALHTVDDDSVPEDIVYSFIPPSNGEIIVRGFPGRVLSFSQRDLELGMVQFMHTGELDGGFLFKVSDGENESEQLFFHIQATPITITMESLHSLVVCPRSLQQITNQHLNAATNEQKGTPPVLVYHIENPPQIGKIIHGGNSQVLTNFTQEEVDAGFIFYQHVESPNPFWSTQDLFSFHVQSPRASSQKYVFNVTVTFQSSCPQLHTKLWKNTGLSIQQGGSSAITLNSLDASNLLAHSSFSKLTRDIVFLIVSLPSHGYLSINGVTLNPENPYFLQSHLENGSVFYTNIKSESLVDSFKFKAQIRPKSSSFHELGDVLTIRESFNITVTSAPILPSSISPPKSKIQLAVGSNISLTEDHLSLDHSLASPDNIVYTILDLPLGVSVETRGNQSTQVLQFTQEDLARSNLILLANQTAVSGEIRFNITDGVQTPFLGNLPIKVLSSHQTILEVKQVPGRSNITLGHISPTLDRMASTYVYKLTRKPSYGQIVVGQVPVSEFQWDQVNNNEVSYEFTNFLSTQDEFEFVAISHMDEEYIGKVTVQVSATVKIGDRQKWPRGCTIKLGPEAIDASELGTYTKSIPQFIVLRHPRKGRFVRFPYESGRGDRTSTNVFTQVELERGLIGLELWEDDQNGSDIQSDRFSLLVSAGHVPPANVTVRFNTVPYNSSNADHTILLSAPETLSTTTNSQTSRTVEATHEMFVTQTQTTSSEPTTLLESISKESTTQIETTTDLISTANKLVATVDMVSATNSTQTTIVVPTRTSQMLTNSTHSNTLSPDLWMSSEYLSEITTQDLTLNSSLSINASSSPNPEVEGTILGFMNSHVYSIVLPVCLVLLFILLGLLLLAYFVRKKKMGKHHIQKVATSAAKTENGASEKQTFRPTEPDRDFPLCDVGDHRGNGATGQTGSQYWV